MIEIYRNNNRLKATLLAVIVTVMSSLSSKADEKSLSIVGHVQESVGKTDLMNAYAVPIDDKGNAGDTIHAGVLSTLNGVNIMTNRSIFVFNTVHKDSTYVFEVGCDGYQPQTVVYKVENLGKRETRREMPITFLERAPRKLGEVTVTASKIKFYNRGDTLVYNADAFQLAEGSMLDGLIAQLPGVELNSDGQIKVNGEFVESLLLNGRDFFDKNNNLLLKNLAAYTVKNIEVYRGESFVNKWMGNATAPKQLTMNVKLKKEYDMGWMINAQGGYGTDDRYLGRLFASWFNNTTRVMLIGNINNLNDTREPGKNSSWTPEQMPSGKMKYQMLGLGYNYQSSDYSKYAIGNVTYDKKNLDNRTYTDRTNFFAGRNTYDYAHSSHYNRDISVRTKHQAGTKINSLVNISGELIGGYESNDRVSRSLSMSYDAPQYDMSMQRLEAIYSDGSADKLSSVINRSITMSDAESRKGNIDAQASVGYKFPKSNDHITSMVRVTYDTKKEKLWDDYDVRFGDATLPPMTRRNFIDNSPNHDMNLSGNLGYTFASATLSFALKYQYNFHSLKQDSYAYALDRLDDMGIYGTLPAGYMTAFDPANSYTSSLLENTHTLIPYISYETKFKNGGLFNITLSPELGVRHSHFAYCSENVLYPVRRTSFIGTVSNANAKARYGIGNRMAGENMYVVMYDYNLDTETPDLLHMVDVADTSDPLNIMLGNPELRNAYKHQHHLSFRFFSGKRRLDDFIDLRYSPVTNALVRGYSYDMTTGIRRMRTYNVSGTYSASVANTFSLQFGRSKEFSLNSVTEASRIHSVDMVGLNVDEPVRSTVNTRNLSETLKLSWSIGRQTLTLKGNVLDRRTSSTRDGFGAINATHINYGFIGQFTLPAGFGLNTDFSFYTRRGYGVKQLDTTDAVWNLRATYTPRGGRWVFTVDGFDLLHQLSNVHYAVNAAGRTVTYTNTLPRYVLFSVQYRLNLLPKKK